VPEAEAIRQRIGGAEPRHYRPQADAPAPRAGRVGTDPAMACRHASAPLHLDGRRFAPR
jgi:hypothetical protein